MDGLDFVHVGAPARVVFGHGRISETAAEAGRLGSRAVVLCTPEQRDLGERVLGLLGPAAVGLIDRARMHVPVDVVDAAEAEIAGWDADLIVAAGGGSTIGLAKGLTLRQVRPTLAIPTTFAGSEMTPIWGLTEGGLKRTGRDPAVAPRTVIYDPALLATLPPQVAVTSALNALAHCVEALYADDRSPIVELMAEEGARALMEALPRLGHTTQAGARATALYGAWLAGSVLGSVSMGLHHKLCHTLGGTFDLPHAPTHAIILPHALAYNAKAATSAMIRLRRAAGAEDVPGHLWRMGQALGIPPGLGALGMPEAGIARAVELAMRDRYPNPRPLEAAALEALIGSAWAGDPPAA